jgi:16S rRNA (guanine1207-N2)-methyltransferase
MQSLIKRRITLPDGPATLVRLPGVPEPGPATDALLQAARRLTGEHIFVMGPGAAGTALWAARQGGMVTYWTDNIAEAVSLEASFRLNHHLARLQVVLQPDFSGLAPAFYTMALVHLPRGRALQIEALALAAALLQPGGRLVFVGATREGVKGAHREAQRLFGHAGIVVRKGGYHAGLAQRPDGAFPIPEVVYETRSIAVDDITTQLVSCPGVFAWDRLDDGAAALIAGMDVEPDTDVLEVGCGTGLPGLAALRCGVRATLVDVSARAVASARRTLAANGYSDVPVLLSQGAAVVQGQMFDTVITNPPFHQGHGMDFEVARGFVHEAARVLRYGGRLYLVANAFLKYEPWLRESFARVSIAWEDRRFKVWRAEKPGF